MLEAIIKGISFGLLLSILIGPVFMYLIEVSITKGVKQALFVDLGIFFSDLSCIILSYIFLDQLRFLTKEPGITGTVAGSIFLVFGAGYLLKRRPPPKAKEAGDKVKLVQGKHLITDVLKGFFLNMMNPSVLIYWLTVMAIAAREFGSNDRHIFAFFTALLITFFSIDVLKILGAAYVKKFLKQTIIERINTFTGVAFLVGGAFFLVRGLTQL